MGGAIASLRHDGRDILRPTPDEAADPLETACFPLVPYANRIANGRFVFAGEEIVLPRNFGDHPHPLHGTGWRTAWDVADSEPASARLIHRHRANAAWPWSFAAEQIIRLAEDGLAVQLILRSEDARIMPAGLGFHPYFLRSPDTGFRAGLAYAWDADETLLPTRRLPPDHFGDWASGDRVERPALVDHCHEGWDGLAEIHDGGRITRLTASGTPWLHLFMPPGAPFLCAEPTTHLPDAVNRRDAGCRLLAPGGTEAIGMTIALG